MDDLCLHIMDIIENCVRAEAKKIFLTVLISSAENTLRIEIKDNGKGMDEEERKRCQYPFYTTKECKKTGMGIALLKQSSAEAEGAFTLYSERGKGTSVTATFRYDHIDRRPIGDVAKAFYLIIAAFPDVDLSLRYGKNGEEFIIETEEIKNALGDIPITAPDVLKTLRSLIEKGISTVNSS